MVIAIYFSDPNKMDYPFSKEHYYESYKAFAKLCAKFNVDLYFSRSNKSYQGNMKFNDGYFFEGDELQHRTQPYKADIILLRGHDLKFDETDRTLNHRALSYVCHDKSETFRQFSECMSPTYEVTADTYKNVLQKIKSDKVVFKPHCGGGGEGIVIVDKKDFTPDMIDFTKQYFAQEFLDSSAGVPGIVQGLHDLRLVLFNGEVKSSFIRQPKEGSYLANLAQGATFVYVPVNKLPASALALAEKIDRKFRHYTPRLYAIDLLYQDDKPYLIELNDQPGMPYLFENKYENSADKFHQDLLKILTT